MTNHRPSTSVRPKPGPARPAPVPTPAPSPQALNPQPSTLNSSSPRPQLFSVLLIVLSLWICVPALHAQIPVNGGFESGSTGWTTSITGGAVATFGSDTAYPHKGVAALKVTVSTPGTATNSVRIASLTFSATATNTYVLRFWANTDKVGAKLGVNLLGATPVYPQIPFIISTNKLTVGGDGYQEYLYPFKASGAVSIAFNFQTAAQYWIDDVQVLDPVNNAGFDIPMTYLWQWGQWNFAQTNTLKIGWTGGDNNKSVLLPDGTVAWIFNDTFSSKITDFYTNIRGGSSLPRNALVHQVGTNLIWKNNGHNSYFVPSRVQDSQMPLAPDGLYWIAGAVAETNKMYVLLNGLNNSPLTNICMAVATFSLPSLTMDGVVTNLTSPGTDNFGDLIRGDDNFYYIYNGAKVARVPVGQLASNAAWRYWNGAAWVADHTQNVAIPNFQGWSVARLGLSNYVAVYKPVLSTSIYAQFAPSPMGPWGHDLLLYTAENQGAQGIFTAYMPNICAGTGSNGLYTIGYSDNGGDTEGWFAKLNNDKSWYNPHYITAPLPRLSPYTINYDAVGGPGSRISIKFAADQNWNHNHIDNTYGAGVLNTTNWFNFGIPAAASGVTNMPYYTMDGEKYATRARIVYSWAGERTRTVDSADRTNNENLLESWIRVNNNTWYLSVTNLDAPFTNGYSLYFYYHGSAVGQGGQNIIRYYTGQTTNTALLGTRQWNLYTTDTSNNGTFIRDLTPANTGTTGETPGANYFVITNLTGGAFDLLISNGNNGGINALELVADPAPAVPAVITVRQEGPDIILTWPRGILLEAPEVTGPWTTNGSPSPYPITPKAPQRYYKLR